MKTPMPTLLNAFSFLLLSCLSLLADLPRKETREQVKYDLDYRLVLLRVTHKPSLWDAGRTALSGNEEGFYHLLINGKLYRAISGVPAGDDKEPEKEQTYIFAFLVPGDLFAGIGDGRIKGHLVFAEGSYVLWEKPAMVGANSLESITVDGKELIKETKENLPKLQKLYNEPSKLPNKKE